jgi:hypothetical protein
MNEFPKSIDLPSLREVERPNNGKGPEEWRNSMINIRNLVKIAIEEGAYCLHLLGGCRPMPHIGAEPVPVERMAQSPAVIEETFKSITSERHRGF